MPIFSRNLFKKHGPVAILKLCPQYLTQLKEGKIDLAPVFRGFSPLWGGMEECLSYGEHCMRRGCSYHSVGGGGWSHGLGYHLERDIPIVTYFCKLGPTSKISQPLGT